MGNLQHDTIPKEQSPVSNPSSLISNNTHIKAALLLETISNKEFIKPIMKGMYVLVDVTNEETDLTEELKVLL